MKVVQQLELTWSLTGIYYSPLSSNVNYIYLGDTSHLVNELTYCYDSSPPGGNVMHIPLSLVVGNNLLSSQVPLLTPLKMVVPKLPPQQTPV